MDEMGRFLGHRAFEALCCRSDSVCFQTQSSFRQTAFPYSGRRMPPPGSAIAIALSRWLKWR